MMKFFRKYNKQLLAVFMALLMVVFIGGSALEGLLRPETELPIGNSKYGEITTLTVQRQKSTVTNILDVTSRDWQRPFGVPDQPLDQVDWFLLVNEAREMGVAADVSEVKAASASQEAHDMVARLAQGLGLRPDAIHEALAEYRSVQNAALAIGAASHLSESEVQKAARDALEKVQINAVVIPAAVFVEGQPEPSAEELTAHFEKYKAAERGEGLEFGYYQDPRARVQYVRIDRDAIMETIGVANLERKAKAYYEENKTKHMPFKRHPGNNPEPPTPAEGEAPATDADEYLTWEEARHIANAAVTKQQASKAAADLARWIHDYDAGQWSDAVAEKTGYRTAPEAVKAENYYAEMLKQVPPHLSFAGAVTIQETEFFPLSEAGNVAELGAARAESGAASLSSILGRSEAFIPELPVDMGAAASDYLAIKQSARPLSDAKSGNHFVFRIVATQPGRPAESVDEVREDVIADLKLLKAYETAKQRADALTKGAGSLQEAFLADTELGQRLSPEAEPAGGFYQPQPFSRVPQMLAAIGRPANGVYVGPGVSRLTNEAMDRIFELAEVGERFGLVELPNRATVIVVEPVEIHRAVEDEFKTLKTDLGQQLAATRWREAISDWFDKDKIRARNRFVAVNER